MTAMNGITTSVPFYFLRCLSSYPRRPAQGVYNCLTSVRPIHTLNLTLVRPLGQFGRSFGALWHDPYGCFGTRTIGFRDA